MSQIRPGLECTTAMLKRLDRVVATINAKAETGAAAASRQSVLEGVDQAGLDAALASLEASAGVAAAMPAESEPQAATAATPPLRSGARARRRARSN